MSLKVGGKKLKRTRIKARIKVLCTAAAAVLGAEAFASHSALASLIEPSLAPGTTFRYLYVTTETMTGSAGGAAGNTLASTDAAANGYDTGPNGTSLTWQALLSTSSYSANSLISTNDVFVLPNGAELASSTNNLFNQALMNPIVASSGGGSSPPGGPPGGLPGLGSGSSSSSVDVWTGSTTNGSTGTYPVGDTSKVNYGLASSTTQWLEINFDSGPTTDSYPVYAFSSELTVPAAVPEPATLGLLAIGAAPLLTNRGSRKVTSRGGRASS
jgi:hypothetical protein